MKTFQEQDSINSTILTVSVPLPGKRMSVKIYDKESDMTNCFNLIPDRLGLAQAAQLVEVLSEWLTNSLRHESR